jgi:hypothetical protein
MIGADILVCMPLIVAWAAFHLGWDAGFPAC